jgi:hypothetical protein
LFAVSSPGTWILCAQFMQCRPGAAVKNSVAHPTKRNQVCFRVVTEGTTPSDVMNVEVRRTSAFLAAPSIAFENFVA